MVAYTVMILFAICCLAIVSDGSPVADTTVAQIYLKLFGSLKEPTGQETLAIKNQAELSTSVEDIHRFADLTVTDDLDNETTSLMNAQRFGVKDNTTWYESGRKKRDADESSLDECDAPDICDVSAIDAITRIKNGNTYVFKGDYYWKVVDHGIPEGYPKLISENWQGLPGNLDAAVTWPNGRTYFFKGNYYWGFINKKMKRHYPKLISVGFEECIPDNINAVIVWSNGKTYFFKDDDYWRHDSNEDPPMDNSRYPAPIRHWSPSLECGVDAAFKWKDGRTYFFKGTQYYKYDDENSKVEEGYPRSTTTDWFGC